MKNKPHIYFLSQRINEHEILKLLGERVGEFFSDDILNRNGVGQWKWFFEYLKKKLKERIVLAIDEFPYLAETTKGISSFFQAGRVEKPVTCPHASRQESEQDELV